MIKKSFTKKYNINGPINIIRLEKDSKIVYIFGDIHNNLVNQTQCEYENNIETIDIDKFFIKLFKKNPDQQYDFFYEGYVNQEPKQFQSYDDYYKMYYLGEIIKLAFHNIKFEDNKVHISNYFPNLRLHYFNIRSSIPSFMTYWNNINILESITINSDIKHILNILENILIKDLNDVIDYFKSNQNEYINKILNKYNDEEIKNQLNKLYNIYILDFLNEILKLCTETIDYIIVITEKNCTKIKIR
jgi:hypothetical protein